MFHTDSGSERPVPRGSAYVAALRRSVEDSPVTRVPVALLTQSLSARAGREDAAHARLLADVSEPLPPIVVHRDTLKVIDGIHRVRAAVLRGQYSVEARFFAGSEQDAFLLAVAANTAHGLPLRAADRLAAVSRIALSHPQWSDRAIAAVAGMSTRKVAQLRSQLAPLVPPPAARTGIDGRTRPLDGSAGRRRAAELMSSDPQLSTREIARRIGVSPSTVSDVRSRLNAGHDPVPRPAAPGRSASVGVLPLRVERPVTGRVTVSAGKDAATLLDSLRRDPSLRFSDGGRALLRMFEVCAGADRERQRILGAVPAHLTGVVSELLVRYGELWQALAREVRRVESRSAS